MSSTPEPDFLRRRKEREKKAAQREGTERDANKRQESAATLRSLIRDLIRYRRTQQAAEKQKEAKENELIPPARSAAHAGWAAAALAFLSLCAFIYLGIRADQTAKSGAHAAASAAKIAATQLHMAYIDQRPWLKIEPEIRSDFQYPSPGRRNCGSEDQCFQHFGPFLQILPLN